MEPHSLESARGWYVVARPHYSGLADVVRSTVDGLLRGAGIEYLTVTARAKTIDSFAEKIERKGYSDPEREMTDLAGVRVIAFIESDVDKACGLIRNCFNIHPEKSLDKSAELGIDQFGYRSVHFICDLGEDRSKLPEYKAYKDMIFEVQVRTVLQHAWAEIEHDRSYKFSAGLPAQLRRRLYLIAGSLELADREFNQIAAELDVYAGEIAKKTERGEFDVELNTTSLREYLGSKIKSTQIDVKSSSRLAYVIPELQGFGIQSLLELDAIMDDDFVKRIETSRPQITETGLVRAAMLLSDIDRYFKKAWRKNWRELSGGWYEMLVEKYGESPINQVMSKFKLER